MQYLNLFSRFSFSGYLNYFQILFLTNDAAMNILIQVPKYTRVNGSNLNYSPRGMTVEEYALLLTSSYCQITLQRGYHSYTPTSKV